MLQIKVESKSGVVSGTLEVDGVIEAAKIAHRLVSGQETGDVTATVMAGKTVIETAVSLERVRKSKKVEGK